jgi:hypothetical protein
MCGLEMDGSKILNRLTSFSTSDSKYVEEKRV